MLPRHYSDEQLLAHLDGELSRRRDGRVRKHLARCWHCRGRLAELEDQVCSLTRAFENQTFLGADRIAGARRRFEQDTKRYERSLVSEPRLHLLPGVAGRALQAGALCMVLLAAVIGVLPWRSSSPLAPGDVLAATGAVEQGIYRAAKIVHQEFRVEVMQTEPWHTRRTSRLELWTEPGGRRFATRWSDNRGTVYYAIRRPEPDSKYKHLYAPGVAEQSSAVRAVSFVSIADYGLEPEQLECAFLRWLQSREWAPISFTVNFRAFCSADGVLIGVERQRGSLRLWARRASGGRRMEMVMEIDAVTFRPRLQAIRVEDASGSAEVRLIADRIEALPAASVKPSVFEPDLGLVREGPRAGLDKRSPLPKAPPPSLSKTDLDEIETEVLYGLHRVRACLGEPINVERVRGESVRVSGLVETTRRRAQLLAALGELEDSDAVTANIQTAEEFLRHLATNEDAEAKDVTATQVGPLRLPIQDELERYFEQRGETSSQVARFANEAIDISKAMLAEAWALRRLGEQYDGQRFEQLKPRSRWLVEVMLRDHLEAFRACSRRGQVELGPVLSSISGRVQHGAVSSPPSMRPASLSRGVMTLFDKAEEVDLLTRGLFAGAGLLAPAEDEAASLLAAFDTLENDSQSVAAQLNGRSSGHLDLRSGEVGPEVKKMP